MILHKLSAEADIEIQLTFIKAGIKEICKHESRATFLTNFLLFWKMYLCFHKQYNSRYTLMVVVVLLKY